MKPTFLKVGVPKNTVRPPTSIRPPTASGNPASPFTNERCYVNTTGTSHDWLIPSGVASGDGILVFIHTEGSATGGGLVTPPAGYTLLDSANDGTDTLIARAYWKISDGTETDTTFTTSGNAEVAALFGRIPANGATLETPDIASPGTTPSTSLHDPSAVTPASGAGTYHMLVASLMNKGGPTPDWDSAVSSGYTAGTVCDVGSGVLSPGIWIQTKDSTAIVTTEDPGTIAWSGSTGSRFYTSFTIAIRVATANPEVVGYPVTASDIDSEASTDGQVLTSDGAGNAAWEDVPGGVSDHGALTGLADDDHTQYVLADGTRAFTGDQSMGSNKLTNVTDPTSAQDAATKAYVDANAGDYYELIVSGSAPPVAVTNEAADDFVYGLVP